MTFLLGLIPMRLWAGAAIAIALGAALLGYGHHQRGIGEARATVQYHVLVDQQKTAAGALLSKETARVAAAEQALRNFKDHQEIQDAQNRTTVTGLQTRLRTLAGNAGQLRDPNATARCGSGGSGPPSPSAAAAVDPGDDAAEAGGLLSADLSGLLQRLGFEADEINVAYASCRLDAVAVRALSSQ